ncbi:endospore germination permease [Brevibacillus agri]|uniref:GerAB/ArcD/ProY family transporter n=1 Tax=Brevibacillus agri TaxID=51101 RepID=UPI0018CE172A|nr:endospore germination permease [Brevibacillus agri]MBG9567999.1 spore gernimation protein [Brevibacillus agri]MED4571941.1 endospore germination permease [Brevibacillus agri]
MKKYAFNELTVFQYIYLIHGAQVGIGVLSMPRELADLAGTDGWLSILIGWIAAMAVSLVIIGIMKRYPGKTIVDLLPLFLGKWLGKVCVAGIAVYCGFASFTVLANTAAIINTWILSQTPIYMVVILLAVPAYMVLQGGLRVLGRYAELIFYLTLWMPIVLVTVLPKTNWLYLLPVFKEGWWPILVATKSTVLSFLGFELAFFLYPFLQKKQYAVLGIVVANTLSMLIFMNITLFSFVFFNPDEILQYTWPTLNLWKVIEYRFLERMDIIFLAFYLFYLSTTSFPYLYFSVFSSSQLFGAADHRKHLGIALLLGILLLWLYTPTFMDLLKWKQWWSTGGLLFGYALPVLAFVPIWLLRRSVKE